ncbi:spore coat protein YlbD [Pullulanibacillus sp. KACC 23026]|uniref:spore coat protein YlbD n=1 Tax=Pullulanibacillus sp. KACC 23026 TaxID=3028315 RepID=UPI0023B059A6|nr:spore coat protein YlbD [Pullulanibacillus sp. KACC 23026]WEG11689.1 spore coat protein YlbD [Pullulanibacillus sp. KACC 23026]
MVKTTKKAVDDFKAFVKKYPSLAKVKRENDLSWQDLFEEWVLYGEDKEFWKEYGITIKSTGQERKLFNFGTGSGTDLSKLMGILNQIDPEDLQEKLKQVDSALTTLSSFIGSFTSSTNSQSANTGSMQQGPMNPMGPGMMNGMGQGQTQGPGAFTPFNPGPNYSFYNRD